jgi:hypothetical protein
MKSVYREKLFYGIQHLENFLLIFFLAALFAPRTPAYAGAESVVWTLDCGACHRAGQRPDPVGAKEAPRNDGLKHLFLHLF